jgi:hypothetical protein
MGQEIKVYKVSVRKHKRNRQLRKPKRRWEHGIKRELMESGWEDEEWIHVATNWDRWRAVVNTVINLRILASQS